MSKSLAKPIFKAQPKAKPRKFTTTAKTMVTAMSVSALIGGWNWIGHFEALKAEAAQAASGPTQTNLNAPLVTPQFTPTPWPTIPALVIPLVAPLPATDNSFAQAPPNPANSPNASVASRDNSVAVTLPPVSVAPLPTLGPLPDLPALPTVSQPPVSSNNSAAVSGNISSSHRSKHSKGS